MSNFESWDNRIDLPNEFDWISNKEQFYSTYEKITSRYWEDFSENEKKIMKETWNRWCKEYGWQFNTTRLAILWNRIDTWIFEFRYPNFINIDKNIIRKISDTNRQRKFREVAIKLIKKYNNLFDSDMKIIEAEFNNAFNNKKTPIFDIIDGKINQNKWNKDQNNDEIISNNNENIQDNSLNNFNWNSNSSQSNYNDIWPSDADVETMLNLKISPFFEWIKKEIFANDLFSTSPNKKYLEWFFNECANNIFELYGDIKDSDELKEELLTIFKQHFYTISQWIEKSSNELTSDIKNKIINMKPGDSLAILVNNAFDKDDKIDYSKFIKIEELTQEDKDAIDYLYSKITWNNHTKEEITNQYLKYKHLEKKQKNWELSEKEKKDFKWLKELFKQTKRLKKLEEIKINKHESHRRRFNPNFIKFSEEYATWNMKEIKPWAIVLNNKQINEYVIWKIEPRNKIDTDISLSELSTQKRTQLFRKLIRERKDDKVFRESIKYLDKSWNIDERKVKRDKVDIESIKINKSKIDKMIVDLAIEEKRNWVWKEKAKKMAVRRSSMICCFRAISKFFDTVNNNWENFASEFEIENVNDDIKFDGKTIQMTGTIWANKNHIWLYYNTETWELTFDNFLAYNPKVWWYKIWKNNWETEKLNIKLPTMNEMENVADNSIKMVDKLPLSTYQYNRMIMMSTEKSIRLNCFKWFMWSKMELNKKYIAQFTEKSILQQDIIRTIYSKFYNKTDIDENLSNCLTITQWNQPEQFELIKLIYNSIDNIDKLDSINCNKNANLLLEFRNDINKLDELLSSKDIIKNDKVLTELFANNLSTDTDIHDNSIGIMKRENKWMNVSDNNTHVHEYVWAIQQNDTNQNLNYYTFLNLLTKREWDKRVIDLQEFKNVLNNIEKPDRNLLNNASVLFIKNYEEYKRKNDIAELAVIEKQMNNGDLWENNQITGIG